MSEAQTTGAAAGQGTGPGANAPRTPVPQSPGAFRIGALSDPNKNRWVKFLIYGPPGAGKTTLLGSSADVPDMQDVLFVSIEGGELAMEDNDRIKNFQGIDVIRMEQIEQLQKLLDFVKIHCQLRDSKDPASYEKLVRLQAQVFGMVEDGTGSPTKPWPPTAELEASMGRIRKYRCIIIDSLTEIEGKNLAKIMGLDNTKDFEVGAIEVSGWAEFRQNNHTIQRIVRAFRDQPIHLGLVCAQSYTQDEMKRFHYGPALTGKLAQQIQGFVDVVGYLVISSAAAEEMKVPNPATAVTRRLYVQPQTGVKFDAKCRRSSYKAGYFNDPTMTTIMKAFGLMPT